MNTVVEVTSKQITKTSITFQDETKVYDFYAGINYLYTRFGEKLKPESNNIIMNVLDSLQEHTKN